MGYQTDFTGQFSVEPTLATNHMAYLIKFNQTRRMKWDVSKVELLDDPIRKAINLPIGPEGAYFVGNDGSYGQGDNPAIINYNQPPEGQPGLWCQWTVTDSGNAIEWDQGEKFYNYVEWITYLIEHFLAPWGYKVNGQVKWYGEDSADLGMIVIEDNKVRVRNGFVAYQ